MEKYTRESPKEIIILAMGPGRGQCPFDAETWALNMGYTQIAQVHGRLDKIFMAHGQVISKEGNPYFKWEDYRRMNAAGIELINLHTVKGVPFKRFPLKTIIKKFDCGYFSNTICYMIAYALHLYTRVDRNTGRPVLKHPLKLRLYGVDMQEKDEYYHEKGGVEYWLGLAWGLGVDFTLSFGCTLLLTQAGVPYGLKPLDTSIYDPFGLLKKPANANTGLSLEEVQKAIEKAKNRKPTLRDKWFNGERSIGLHRDLSSEADKQSFLMSGIVDNDALILTSSGTTK